MAPTTTIWERSQGVKEIGGKHHWAHQALVHRLPTPMLEGSGSAGTGDSLVALPALGAGFGKGVLALAWESLVTADSGSLKSNSTSN